MGFAESIQQFADKTKADINKNITDTATDLFTQVVNYSPSIVHSPVASFSKGQLINNWFAYANSLSVDYDPSTSDIGVSSLNRITNMPSDTFIKTDGYLALTNNVDWAYRAEYLGWPSPKWSGRVGAYAMVRNAMNDVSSRLGAK